MFGQQAKQPSRRSGALSIIGADVTVTGNIVTQSDIHVEGTVQGDIACGALVQGPSGTIVGTIRSDSARLAGVVDGTIATTSLTVERTARITGELSYDTLTIETGAQVDGKMTHLTATVSEPPLRLVDASDG